MKKLVVLAMICAMASLASAGLVYTLNGVAIEGDTIDIADLGTLGVNTDIAASGYTIELSITGAGTFDYSGITWASLMMGNGPVAGTDTPVSARLTGSNFMPYGPGEWFSGLAIVGAQIGDVITFDDQMGLDDASFTIVPEPMTMALLGLGGLFIRRRK